MYTSPARSQGSPGQSAASCDRLLANLFRDLATQESLVSAFEGASGIFDVHDLQPNPHQNVYMTTNAFFFRLN